jgi:hypothetical protein
MAPTSRPNTALAIQNCFSVKVRPACCNRAAIDRIARFCCRSWSLRVLRIALRRLSGLFAAARAARTRVAVLPPLTIAWARLTVRALLLSPPAKTKPRPAIITKARTATRTINMAYSAASRASASSRSSP